METGLFAEIHAKGDGVTSNLKKVTADMKAKNRSDNIGLVTTKASPFPAKSSSFPAPLGDPTISCVKDVWQVKNITDREKQVVLVPNDPSSLAAGHPAPPDASSPSYMKQSVSITDCHQATFQLEPTKFNSVMIYNCTKTNVIVNSLISAVEICDCSKVKLQVLGVVPCIAIDKSTGVDIFLSAESKGSEITTSKSGEMNLNFPREKTTGGDEDEWVEVAIPEQFVHNINVEKNNLSTIVSHLYSC